MIGRDDDVAHQRDLAAAAEGEAVDRGDDRLRDRVRHHAREAPCLLGRIVGIEAFAARQRDKVSARAEALVACAGDDDDADFGVVLGLFERGADADMDRGVDRVTRLGPVDRDDQHMATAFGEDGGVGHRESLPFGGVSR
jgi:hypothetical protein